LFVAAAGNQSLALWDLSSFVLVLGGTVGITMMTTPSEDLIEQ
jgi:flagellar motor component MotA